ncbi:hypothetical protein K492DRAFT_228711 [Lichtheimia hyalospora FSU 10163]|nr:hypothetical protein K492DRAFT_228711 [Lichtheimia hyalospora FSU 10163]
MDNVLTWDENKVSKWLASIGYSAYEKQFKEHGITGDVLVNLDHETLKDLSMHSVGQRMEILKHIYTLKALWRIPLNEWDYVPPTVLYENDWLGQNGMADYRKIEAAFHERDGHMRQLTEELHRVSNEMMRLREEMGQHWKLPKDKKPLPVFEIEKSPSTPSAPKAVAHFMQKSGQLLTPPTLSSNHGGSNGDYFSNSSYTSLDKSVSDEIKPTGPNVMVNDGGAIKVYGDKISNSSKVELESSKNVRLLLDDTCSKVITSALKKYNVVADWQQYSLWIQYGPYDNPQERQLGYDEKPLKISQKLKEAKQNPVFVLKHVKDNKIFNPAQHASNNPDNKMEGSSSRSNHLLNAFTSPRPAPKPTPPISYDDDHHSGRSTPQNGNGWKNTSADKRTLEHPKTAITSGRVGYEVVVPVMSSSISTPTPSTSSVGASGNDTPPSTLTPSSAKRAGTINRKPSENLLSELGLESGMANVIYTIMMDQNQNGN